MIGGAAAVGLVLVGGCTRPDRTAEADELIAELGELPGVVSAAGSYSRQTLESSEQFSAAVEVADTASADDACAVATAYLELSATNEIDNARLDIGRTDRPLWTFQVDPDDDSAGAAETCIASHRFLDVPGLSSMSAAAGADGRRSIRLTFEVADAPTAADGLALATATVDDITDFEVSVFVLCDDSGRVCSRLPEDRSATG